MIRVVIADDHTIVREGLKQLLGATDDLEVVGEARDGHETMKIVRERDFDVLLMDLSMPGKSGMELIKQVRSEKPKLRILVLSMHAEHQYAVRAIKAGASGYLTKDSAARELVSALRKVAAGGAIISAEVAEQLAHSAMPQAEGPAARVAVRSRVPGLPAAGGRDVGVRHRDEAQPLGQDRQHAQGAHLREDGAREPGRAHPLRDPAPARRQHRRRRLSGAAGWRSRPG